MLAAVELITTLSGALFTGAALYINLVEHPARMSCGTKIAVTQWAPSYARAAVMQASLAIVSLAFRISRKITLCPEAPVSCLSGTIPALAWRM